jgi:NAD(P)-dependent dehydrogenase (short-subunit alcohol dehydrogenase family)
MTAAHAIHLAHRLGLEGRTAAITGAAGGLGAGIAHEFAAAGMRLALCDIAGDRLTELAAGASLAPQVDVAQAIDVRDDDALAGFFAAIDAAGRGIDVLVNVVGGTFDADFVDTRPRGWEALYRANLHHLLTATQHAARRMIAAGSGGSIIHITSIEAHRAAPGFAVYAAMKAAVDNLARSLAVELGPHRIRVNCIAPDYVPTDGVVALEHAGDVLPITEIEAAAVTPIPRLGRVDDVSGCALFLASDLAAFVTGTTLHPDGGALAAGRWMRVGERWVNRLPARWLDDPMA